MAYTPSANPFSIFLTVKKYYRVVTFVVIWSCIIQLVVCYNRGVGVGKIRADLPGVELSDYRFGLGQPYVMFYEKDNYRGSVHFQVLGKMCKNLPDSRQNWASSVDVQKRCITVCEELDCKGHCVRIHSHPENPNNKGASKLSLHNINDKIKSVKFCY